MFRNIGKKIMSLARVISGIIIALFSIGGIIIIVEAVNKEEDGLIISGLLVIAIGILVAWLSSFMLYGYGQLIENTSKLNEINESLKSIRAMYATDRMTRENNTYAPESKTIFCPTCGTRTTCPIDAAVCFCKNCGEEIQIPDKK